MRDGVKYLSAGAAAGLVTAVLGARYCFAAGYPGLWAGAALLLAVRRRSPGETFRDIALALAGMDVFYYLARAVRDSLEGKTAVEKLMAAGQDGQLRCGGGWQDWLCGPDIKGMLLYGIAAVFCGLWGYIMLRYRHERGAWTFMALVPIGICLAEAGSLVGVVGKQTAALVPLACDLALAGLGIGLAFRSRPEPEPEESDEEPPAEEEIVPPTEEEKWLL